MSDDEQWKSFLKVWGCFVFHMKCICMYFMLVCVMFSLANAAPVIIKWNSLKEHLRGCRTIRTVDLAEV